MKGKLTIGILAIATGLLAYEIYAQTTPSKPAKQATAQSREPALKWEKLTPGAEVLRLRNAVPDVPNYPEVAILKLSRKEYSAFKMDRSAYLNEHHVFSAKVRSGATLIELTADKSEPSTKPVALKMEMQVPPQPGSAGLEWMAMCGHTMTSRSGCIASEIQ